MKKISLLPFINSLTAIIVFGLAMLSPMLSSAAAANPTGQVYIWGVAHSVGNTTSSAFNHASPYPISGLPNPIVQVVATNTDYYALDSTGAVWAWGAAENGQIGTGSPITQQFVTTPTQVQFPAGVTIASLPNPMPDATGMAIDTNGNVWGWGYNNSNQLCLKGANVNTPEEVPLPNVTLATGAGDHALYYSNGTLYACGTNDNGDLGIGITTTYKGVNPVAVTGLPADEAPINLQSSYHNSGVVLANGTYYDWGLNSAGQVGNGTVSDSVSTPTQVPLPTNVSQVYLGGSLATNGQSIAVLSDGSIYMWGNNTYGQLANGNTTNETSPSLVTTLPSNIAFVASGGSAAYAIDSSGNVYAWGQNNSGQLGIGKSDKNAHTQPVEIPNVQLTTISATAFNVIGM